MTFETDVDGHRCAVSIEPVGDVARGGGRFRVAIRDLEGDQPARVYVVDSRPTALGLSLAFDDGRMADPAVTTRPNGEYLIQFPGVDVPVLVDGRRRRQGESAGAGQGQQRITAPMPGRVLRVLVQSGDDVVARQGLVVVEAMKMENELRAARAGRVREVVVTEGTSVEAGRLLVVIE
ncbi:MAG: biotin/lipoyl-containing protein [Acidobacteriota bacterium]